jgi:transcriptional regulator with XRE-family HTH domain
MSEKQSVLDPSPTTVGSGDDVPRRLREAREEAGLSLRQLARRLEISASALSQIETAKSRPSVRTLYALVSELNLSMDQLFDNPGRAKLADAPFTSPDEDQPSAAARQYDGTVGLPTSSRPVQHAADRARLELDSGVRWERLTSEHDSLIDFLHVTYEPGGASNSESHLVRHAGREYGIVLTGKIDITIGFETYRCEPGDSISFNSDEPHLLANNCAEPATAIWFVVGRRGADRQKNTFVESEPSSRFGVDDR